MSPSMLDDGVHQVVHRDHYDRIERVNFSTLKLFSKSPAHYHHGLVTPPEDSDAKKLGRVVHLAAFEPERFRSSVAVWDQGRRAGKEWDAFRQRNEGLELLTENEYDRCLAIQKAVRGDATAMKYVSGGGSEVTMLWTLEVGKVTFRCKGRIDFDAQTAVADLKSTRDASPDAFGRQAYGLSYHVQAAWYSDAHELLAGRRKPYVIIAAENEAPYVVQVYVVPEHLLNLGRETYLEWLDRLAFCRSTNYWPGYSDGSEMELELPRWAYPFDDDISGEGLTSGGKPIAGGE